MAPIERDDPYSGFNFQVTIDGVTDGVETSFSEASGLEVEIPPIEYRDGNEDSTLRKIPGIKKFTNIVLKRGITGDLSLWRWTQEVLDGKVRRADGTIRLLDESREEVLRWSFVRGWPCRYSGPSLNAESSEVAIEVLEICHEGLRLDD